ncbi:MAG: hypothetical protein IKC22_01365 [Bacilli bacterium]|nr:hypothetical protein [bacterium]MBR2891033.1 hypothetical protein [Bacilli bacterium]MBR4004014.1 hypothetical protein [Clostridia bacterium]
MEIAIAIVTLILLCILTLNALYFFISMIISDWKANKAAKELSNLFNKLIEEKKTNKTTNIDYSKMNIIDLKKIAQKKKIKGYYKLSKDELLKVLRETEILAK